MRILVTGASGLLGLNLALTAAMEAAEETIVFGQVHRHALRASEFTVIQADLRDPQAVEGMLAQTQPDWVINCAALAILDACESDPLLARQLNVDLPANLAADVGRGGARLLHVSTDAVFDGRRGEYREEDTPNPLSVYARTKLEGEQAVAAANPDAIIARVNLYGWSLSGKRSLSEFFFYNLQAGKVVQGFTDVYFCPLLANDLAQIFLRMMALNLSGLYHVVSSECLSKFDFGVAIARRFGFDEGLVRPASVVDSDLKAARSPNLSLRNGKLLQALGEPLPGLTAGLDQLFFLFQQGYPHRLRRMVETG